MNTILILGQCNRPLGIGLGLGPKFFHSDFGHDSGDVARFRTVGEVALGSPLPYFNSPLNVCLAPSAGNFSEKQRIESDTAWTVRRE